MAYVKNTWVNEVLAGAELYDVLTETGTPLYQNTQINLVTGVVTAGTLADAEHMNNIEDGIEAVDISATESSSILTSMRAAATELTLDTGEITVIQSNHKLQPESGTEDELDTISGTSAGQTGVLTISDNGTDTITIKHGTGNISCPGGDDIELSEGCVFWYSDGVTVFISGGGGGGVVSSTGQNFLHNGDFRVAQQGTSFTSATTPDNGDDTYLFDRWILLSDGDDIVDVSKETSDLPPGVTSAAKLEVETANKQFGFFQIIESIDAIALVDGTVSLSFWAKMGAADDNTHSLKAVVISWDGTADVVTSDCVASWGATPTLVANWTRENTEGSNTLTTSWQQFKIEGVSIDTSGTKNVGVFIYCDQTDGAVDDIVYMTKVKLEPGDVATGFIPRPYAEELLLCKRYGEMVAAGVALGYYGVGRATSTTTGAFFFNYTEKRAAPTLTISDVTKFKINYAGTTAVTTNLTSNYISTRSCRLEGTVGSAVLTVSECVILVGDNTSNTTHWIWVDANL